MAAREGISDINPEGTNDPELLNIVIEQVGSCATSSSSSLVSCDDDAWFNSIVNAELSAGNNQGPSKIPKVRDMLRNVESNKDCYDPEVVSIGPYHHGKPGLQEIEKLKIKCAKQCVADIDNHGAQTELEKVKKLYEEVKMVADEARKYYDMGGMDVSNEKFTRMMFLDGCFILHFICLYSPISEIMRYDLLPFVSRDLFLMENQLPSIVLEALMSKMFEADEGKRRINEFIRMNSAVPPNNMHKLFVNVKSKQQEPAHLLELLQMSLVVYHHQQPTEFIKKSTTTEDTLWPKSYPSAKELNNVGITFKPNKSGTFRDVAFATRFLLFGELTLAPLIVDDATKSMLLNMVAWETRSTGGPGHDFWVTSYICFINSLLRDAEDVKVLTSHNILFNYLGNKQQVVDLFDDMSNNLLVPHPLVYSGVYEDIETHLRNRVKLLIAEWLHAHFSTTWALLAFLAAILAIALTLIQTYFTAYPPNKG